MSAHWQVVQDLCADRFEAAGFTVERHDYGTGVNVIGVRMGSATPAERVLIGAHYDHIEGCPGADDNASGVAGVLEAARVLSMASYARTLVVACWDEEERGLIGSEAYAARARAASETIVDYFNFEMIGYKTDEPDTQTVPAGFELLFPAAIAELRANQNRGDFVSVIGDPASMATMDALERHADRIGLPFIAVDVPESLLSSPLAGDIRRSDHAAFWDEMYPGMLITDTSEFRYRQYHCMDGDDVASNLDAEFASDIVRITVAAAAESLGHPAGP
jgi:Zn-dependent M28 family amino/carboxypeptidase